MKTSKKTILFAVAGYNLAETGRMLEIAKEARRYFNIIFMSYGGTFEELIEKNGFELRRAEPRLSEKRLKEVRKVLSGATFNTVDYIAKNEYAPRIENEIALFNEIKPVCVLTGWCLTVTISARVAKIPFVNVLHSTSVREYYEAGLQNWPGRFNSWWLRLLVDEEKFVKFLNQQVLKINWIIKGYNKEAEKYGLEPFTNFIDLIEGDYTLLADIPEWVGFEKIRPNLHYIGPLPARIDLPIPDEVVNIPVDKPIIYFAMGSSGKPQIIADIIEGFRNKPYRVIAPVKNHIEHMKLDIPENVVITGFLPAHKVNPMADISVIHGGQNTVMNACLSGTPIVGVGMHAEQEANLESCVRKGFAIRIPKYKAKGKVILEAIDELLANKEAKDKIETFRKELEKWDGPKNGAEFLRKTFDPQRIIS